MNVMKGTARVVTGAGEIAVSAVGAVGGAAAGSIGGGIRGAVEGAVGGAHYGRRSTPMALATMGAAGAVGLVEWPILLAAGGTALVLRSLRPERSDSDATSEHEVTTPASSPPDPSAQAQPAAELPPGERAPRSTPAEAAATPPATVPARPLP